MYLINLILPPRLSLTCSSELSEVETYLHPGPGVLTEIVGEIPLSNYEAAAHFTIAAYAFKLLASFASRSQSLQLEKTDIKLFRIVLHVMTNPQIRVPTKIFDILLNLTAVRRRSMWVINFLFLFFLYLYFRRTDF